MDDYCYIYRTKISDLTEYETALCNALFAILGQSIHDVLGLSSLNQSDAEPPDRRSWTEELFLSEMAQLGDGPETGAPEPVRY